MSNSKPKSPTRELPTSDPRIEKPKQWKLDLSDMTGFKYSVYELVDGTWLRRWSGHHREDGQMFARDKIAPLPEYF